MCQEKVRGGRCDPHHTRSILKGLFFLQAALASRKGSFPGDASGGSFLALTMM